jgi:hypothetical protein
MHKLEVVARLLVNFTGFEEPEVLRVDCLLRTEAAEMFGSSRASTGVLSDHIAAAEQVAAVALLVHRIGRVGRSVAAAARSLLGL